jgi:hypothetical protein
MSARYRQGYFFIVCLFLADMPAIFAENKEDHGKQQTESLRMAGRCDQKA